MNYASIDSIITAWAASHELHLHTTYRDEEVRSVDVVGPNGKKCQLWIDAPDENESVQVHVWDFKKNRKDYETSIDQLKNTLEKAYKAAAKITSLGG